VYKWSNISNSLALGWWMVQMIVRPPRASDFNNEMHWKHEELSRPLKEEIKTKHSLLAALAVESVTRESVNMGPADLETGHWPCRGLQTG
jgi:hypothetical protein